MLHVDVLFVFRTPLLYYLVLCIYNVRILISMWGYLTCSPAPALYCISGTSSHATPNTTSTVALGECWPEWPGGCQYIASNASAAVEAKVLGMAVPSLSSGVKDGQGYIYIHVLNKGSSEAHRNYSVSKYVETRVSKISRKTLDIFLWCQPIRSM